MKTIKGIQNADTATATGYSGIYEGGRGLDISSVTEPRISTGSAATQRAYAQLLDNGYEKTELTIDTPFDGKVNINSIIKVTALQKGIPRRAAADRFIVKEIEIKGDANTIIMGLKAERYD